MADAKLSMMMSEGLTPAEEAKADRLDGPLSGLFIRAGLAVRFCVAFMEDGRRTIGFRDVNLPGFVVKLPAAEFVSLTDREVLSRVQEQL